MAIAALAEEVDRDWGQQMHNQWVVNLLRPKCLQPQHDIEQWS